MKPYFEEDGIVGGDKCLSLDQGQDTGNRATISPKGRGGEKIITHGKAPLSKRNQGGAERRENFNPEIVNPVGQIDPTVTTLTETQQIIPSQISFFSVGDATCLQTAGSKNSENSPSLINRKPLLPPGIRPYYEDESCAIILGDCREVLPRLAAFDLLITDPPYGINHSSSYGASWADTKIQNDHSSELRDWVLKELWLHPAYVFGTWKVQKPANTRQVLIWDKGPASGMGDLSFPWKNSFEEIYVIGDGFSGYRDEAVLRGHLVVTWESHGRCHPNQKPESLLKYLIMKTSATAVLDPFMGSGTTLRAAKDLGRRAIGIEIEEKYCAIAAERLSQKVFKF